MKFEKENEFEHDCLQIAQAGASLLICNNIEANNAPCELQMRLAVSLEFLPSPYEIPSFDSSSEEKLEDLNGFHYFASLVPPQSTGTVTINILGIRTFPGGDKWSLIARVCHVEVDNNDSSQPPLKAVTN